MTVNLRAERVNRGLSVRDAAEQMGISPNTLASAERGDREPHTPTAFKIADFYGFKVTDVWPLDDAPEAAAV